MKNISFIIILLLTAALYGQVGIGTDKPRGALDINNPLTNTMGLVLPTNPNVNNMVNPQGGAIVPGTIMYDNTLHCVRYFRSTTNAWSNCLMPVPTDAIRNAMMTVGCPSCSGPNGYDAVAVNSWVQITDQEYQAIANVVNIQGIGKYLAPDAVINTNSDSPCDPDLTYGAFYNQATVPASNYVVAFSVKSPPNASLAGNVSGFQLKIQTGTPAVTGPYTDYGTPPATFLPANSTRYYFVIKRPTVKTTATGPSYIGAYVGSGYLLSNNTMPGNVEYFNSTAGNQANTPESFTDGITYVQILATPTQDW